MQAGWEDQLRSQLADTYTLERELGGGGMSRVFLATETALGRQVVIKILPPQLAEGVSTERFTREIRLAARLQHPHIVPLLSAGEAGGLPWFAMPFVEGESLRAKLVRSGELPIPDVLRALREIATALVYAHGRGVVHRDIKPENILLSGGTAMVSDFGVAKALVDAEQSATGLTSLGVAFGTPAYMAPEQGMADPRMDQRADIYAFGVVAYELLAGRTPFQGRSPQATLAAHVTEAPEPIDRLRSATPPALAALVMQCLAKSPADRPQSASQIVQLIDGLTTPSAGTLPHVTMPAAPPSASSSGNRKRLAAIAAGVLCLAVGGWYVAGRLYEPAIAERRIAVAPFENLTGDPQVDVVGRMASDWLAQGIARAESVEVVSTMAVTAALTDAPKGANMVELLARATRASVVVSGTIYPLADSLRLQASVVDARTGRELMPLDPVTAARSDPMPAIEALRERLLGAVAAGADVGRSVGLRAPRFSAYQEYLKGEEMFAKNQVEARAFFERAIALDSTLVPAYIMLAVTYSNGGLWDSSQAISSKLEPFKDRFTPFERAMYAWQEANLSGSNERQLEAAQALVARDSVPGTLYLIGLHANALLRSRTALAATLKADSANVAVGWAPQVQVMANAYHGLGRHDEELAMLRRRRRDFPNSANIPARDLRALGALGRAVEALALTDTVLRGITNPTGQGLLSAVLSGALEFEVHHRDTATANAMARRVIAWHRDRPAENVSAGRLQQVGRAWIQLGALDSAERVFSQLSTRDTTGIAVRGHLGLIMALKGDTARARATADSLGLIQRKWLFGTHTYWRGIILGALGDKDAAVRLLRQASAQGQSRGLMHVTVELRSLRGYPAFEALVTPER